MYMCSDVGVLIEARDKTWRHTTLLQFPIPCVVGDCGRRMGMLAPQSSCRAMPTLLDGMPVPVGVMPTLVYCPALTPKAFSPRSMLGSSYGCVATGAWNDVGHHLWARPYAQ